ncbi:MAG: MBL fold metallo-hydrolase, partial [Chloroflexi bacterium]|nr:MBL fold metallo-hydrolase [Chloroflexota bacterium]
MLIRFWGTRGSIPTPGAGTVRYGGNTSCVEIRTDSGIVLVMDCGTGARPLGERLLRDAAGAPLDIHVLLTHTHWDHIQGFPFFAPAFMPGNRLTVYGPGDSQRSLTEALAGQMQYTYFPVNLVQLGAGITYKGLAEEEFTIGDVRIRTQYLNHPAVTLGYRIEVGGVAVAYCTDHEPFSPQLFRSDAADLSVDTMLHEGDRRHAAFLQGVDVLIHDAQYTEAEYQGKRNWGHSTIPYVVNVARTSGVKRTVLFHHDPTHDDAFLDREAEFARAIAAKAGSSMEIIIAAEGKE